MKDISDFAANDPTKIIVLLFTSDGEMQSFEEKKESLTKFIVKTQEQMKTLPGKLQKI